MGSNIVESETRGSSEVRQETRDARTPTRNQATGFAQTTRSGAGVPFACSPTNAVRQFFVGTALPRVELAVETPTSQIVVKSYHLACAMLRDSRIFAGWHVIYANVMES